MMGYKYEKSGEGTLDKNREQNLIFEFAEELFKSWDQADDTYIEANILSKHLVDLGLATNRDFVYRMISVVLKKPLIAVHHMKVTCEEFKKMTISSRMVNRILKILNT